MSINFILSIKAGLLKHIYYISGCTNPRLDKIKGKHIFQRLLNCKNAEIKCAERGVDWRLMPFLGNFDEEMRNRVTNQLKGTA